jgi:hypothetical protein
VPCRQRSFEVVAAAKHPAPPETVQSIPTVPVTAELRKIGPTQVKMRVARSQGISDA